MKIGGFQKSSLIDYPEKISAVIFTQGCNYRCVYCHNPELISSKISEGLFPEEEIIGFLDKRKGLLDGVVICGGEPTLQEDLIDFSRKLKKIGYSVKLDTNGSRPEILKEMIEKELVDYIAMDIKAPLKKYSLVANAAVNPEQVKESLFLIMNSGLPYQFRTVFYEKLLQSEDIEEIRSLIPDKKRYVLSSCLPRRNTTAHPAPFSA